MKKLSINRLTSFLLIICMMIPMLSAIAPLVGAEEATVYPEGNGWLASNPNAPDGYAYSIAVVGDTQSIVKKDLTNGTNYMSNIYNWLAANGEAKNIQYVLGVGDITEFTENFDNNFDGSWTYDDEWVHAKNAITVLDNKIPYSLCRGGGHDTVNKFNTYFGSHAYYTGNLSGTFKANDVTSSYSEFKVGDVEYLLFALDWNPGDAVLEWAGDIIAENSSKRVIITTHAYLAADGTLHGSSDSHTAVPETNNGVDIYEKLVSKYDNIQLVISGHDPSADVVYRQDVRESGSIVTSLLVDPQTFDSQNNAETGMVCMLYFSEDGNTMSVEWYSTVREQYYKNYNQYTLKLNELPSEDGGIVTKYGVIPEKYTDPDSYPFVCFVDGEFYDTKAYDLFNYASGTMERALRKLSADKEIVVIARKNIDVIDGSTGYLTTNYMAAKVTVDLMGYTVNANTATPANLFSSNATQTFDTDITVKNGKLILGKGLLSVSTGGADKTQNFTFEDLRIVSYYKELLVFNQYKTAGDVNIDLVDCDIIAASSSALVNVFRAGNSGDKTPLMNVSTTVKGGSVNYLASDFSKFVQEYNGSTVSFLPDYSNDLTEIIVPTGASVGEKGYKGADGTTLSLIKSDVTDAGDVYSFTVTVGGGIETPYGTIPAELASPVEYPFIVFVNGEVMGYSDTPFIDRSGCLERALRSKNTGGGAVIMLRKDYVLPEKGFLYTNYQKGVFTVDLMGHTIENPYAENLFSSNGTQTHETTLIVKNGTLKLAKALLSVSTHKNAPDKIQNFTFENLDIIIDYNHLAFHNTSASAGKVNINYINCDITASNVNINIFTAGKSATDTNFVTDITVKGGSITIAKFTESRLAPEYNGGSVTFLPDGNGSYFTVYLPASAAAPTGSYNDGKLGFVKVSDTEYTLGEAHTHSYTATVTAPTCTEKGYTTYTCSCGDSYVSDETPVIGHAYDNDFDADCNNCGEVREVELPTSGEVSRKIFWAFEDGVLSITGRGKIKNFSAGVTPWSHLADRVNKVVIGEGVTYIGSSAFFGFTAIDTVNLPNSLTAIGRYAFYGCSSLKNITIPESVTEIGAYAFRRSGVETVEFGIGYGWSAGDKVFSVTEITAGGYRFISKSYYKQDWVRDVNASVETLPSDYVAGGVLNTDLVWTLTALDNGKLKLTVGGRGMMPDFGTACAPWYGYAADIVDIEVCEGVTSVGRCAFYGLKFVRTVTLAETVTAIGDYGFYMCRLMKTIELPESVTVIGKDAFTKTGVTV